MELLIYFWLICWVFLSPELLVELLHLFAQQFFFGEVSFSGFGVLVELSEPPLFELSLGHESSVLQVFFPRLESAPLLLLFRQIFNFVGLDLGELGFEYLLI